MPGNRLCSAAIILALLLLPCSSLAQEKTQPPNTPAGTTTPPQTPAPAVPTPTISAIQPAIPFNIPNQTLTAVGTNFQDGVAVTLDDPQGVSVLVPQDQIVFVSPTKIVMSATLAAVGKWKIKAANPKGTPSNPFEFSVVAYPAINPDSPAVRSYWLAFYVATGILIVVFLTVAGSLGYYMRKSEWSLGDALSEESSSQPKEIHSRKDVIMVASSSRLIALLGLLGILTIVLGVGFSIIWNLFLYGTVPQLAQVRSFLYGAACLFAPYLANQLRSVFDSTGTGTAGGPIAEVPEATIISGISPSRPAAQVPSQALRITGNGFREHLKVALTQPDGTNLAPTAIDSVDPTLIVAHAALATPGNWKVTITNEGANPSVPFGFTIVGPPTVTATDPAAIPAAAARQTIAFTGSGFMSELTVSLRDPTGTTTAVPAADLAITPNRVNVTATINTPGNWTAIITNPGTAAVEFRFTVVGQPTISATDPGTVVTDAAHRVVSFIGSGFMAGLTVSLRDPTGTTTAVPAADLAIAPNRVNVTATINMPGDWTAIITNPGTAEVQYAFRVKAP